MKKYIFSFILFFFFCTSLMFSKNFYIITLKNGTKIKANYVAKFDGYLKVYKYGGYIIYPQKAIRSIKFVSVPDEIKYNDNNSTVVSKECNLNIKEFKVNPIFNNKKGIFNVEVKGVIENNCENSFNEIKLLINFMDKKRKLIAKKILYLDNISPNSKKDFKRIFNDLKADNITYFLYQLKYIKTK